jgi:hypothetical protein
LASGLVQARSAPKSPNRADVRRGNALSLHRCGSALLSSLRVSWSRATGLAAPAATSSDASPSAWRRFALILTIGAAALTATILVTAYALDPFDTGRPPLFQKAGVRQQGPRTAGASRGRDPAFNAALFRKLAHPAALAGAAERADRSVLCPAFRSGDRTEGTTYAHQLVHAPPS